MKFPAKKIDRVSITRRSQESRDLMEDVILKSERVSNDPDKKDRLEKCQCKSCYYLRGRIGGAAITNKPCDMCKEEQMFSSTCTDALCTKCAKDNDLCKFCGGDLHMRVRRRDWPEGL